MRLEVFLGGKKYFFPLAQNFTKTKFSPQKICLNSTTHVLASFWDIFEVHWQSLNNFRAILVCSYLRDFWRSKSWFFYFQGLQIIRKPYISAKNQSTCKATCVSFNLNHFSGQLVQFEKNYSNFSNFNSKFVRIPGWENFIILSWSH